MATPTTLQEAYDDACAVFTNPVRFVEWKMFEVRAPKGPYKPYEIEGNRFKNTYRRLEGERWIYVFRVSKLRQNTPAQWVDELHVVDGKISATSMIKANPPGGKRLERDKRKQVAVGDSVTFARRVLGEPQIHYFFASRIQLPLAQIEQLELKIANWGTPFYFEPNDPNIVGSDQSSAILVPVLDPITIALHLHKSYVEAADDVTNYDTAHDKLPEDRRERVKRRNKKVLLADIVDKLLDVYTGDERSAIDQSALWDFRQEYKKQVETRTKWRDMWASYLVNWIQSPAIELLADAHRFEVEKDWHKFHIPMALCHDRLSASPAGRKLLGEQLDENNKKWEWIHQYLFVTKATAADKYQIGRKLGGSGLEMLKEYVGVLKAPTPELFRNAMKSLYNLDTKVEGVLVVPGKVLGYDYVSGGKVEVYTRWVLKTDQVPTELKPRWHGSLNGAGAFLELVNLGFSIKAAATAFKGDDPAEEAWAVVALVGSGLDFGTGAMALLKVGGKKLLGGMAFVSGVIDAVIAVKDTITSYKDGEMGAAAGNFLTAVGSVGSMIGGILVMSGGNPVIAIVGLAIVGLGMAVKVLFTKSDMERFLEHCHWGTKYGKSTSTLPGWADKPFADWKGDYDAQFRALARLLCAFDISANSAREAKLKMKWVPEGSWIELHYTETWRNSTTNNRDFRAWVKLSSKEDPSIVPTGLLVIERSGKSADYIVRPNPSKVSSAALTTRLDLGPDDLPGKQYQTVKNADIQLEAKMVLKIDDEELNVPAKGYFSETLTD